MSTSPPFSTSAGPNRPYWPVSLPAPAADSVKWLGRPTARSRRPRVLAIPPGPALIASQTLTLPVSQATLAGELELPPQATGLVLLGHGGGSSRLSTRSRHLSRLLQQADLGVLSLDLLTPAEARGPEPPMYLAQLTQRLVAICRWLHQQPELAGLTLGLMGEGNAAAAALTAAKQHDAAVDALVALGGEGAAMTPGWSQLPVPTLLLVGEHDASKSLLASQQQAHQTGSAPNALHIIPQAGPTFQEPGTLAQVCQQAAAWFTCYLARPWTTHG